MDKCGIGVLSGTNCGSVTVKGNMITEYQALSDCLRDITGHLEMLKMRGDDVLSEKELILLRAGKDIFVALSSRSFPSVTNVRTCEPEPEPEPRACFASHCVFFRFLFEDRGCLPLCQLMKRFLKLR